MCYRGVAQVVARMTGGHEAASSSLVTPIVQERENAPSDWLIVRWGILFTTHFLNPQSQKDTPDKSSHPLW